MSWDAAALLADEWMWSMWLDLCFEMLCRLEFLALWQSLLKYHEISICLLGNLCSLVNLLLALVLLAEEVFLILVQLAITSLDQLLILGRGTISCIICRCLRLLFTNFHNPKTLNVQEATLQYAPSCLFVWYLFLSSCFSFITPPCFLQRHPAITPPSYPQVQAPIVNNPAFWERLGSEQYSTDTLFFAFYYQQVYYIT